MADARKLKEKGLVFGSDYYAAEAIYGGLKGWRIQVQTDQSAALSKLAHPLGQRRLAAERVIDG